MGKGRDRVGEETWSWTSGELEVPEVPKETSQWPLVMELEPRREPRKERRSEKDRDTAFFGSSIYADREGPSDVPLSEKTRC